MVPGQVIAADTIGFMRKLDVKEIHGYNNTRGLKLIKLSAIPPAKSGGKSTPARGKTKESDSESLNALAVPSKGKSAARPAARR
jgi:arginine decarboxylase